jgi:hypothetical protein
MIPSDKDGGKIPSDCNHEEDFSIHMPDPAHRAGCWTMAPVMTSEKTSIVRRYFCSKTGLHQITRTRTCGVRF